MKKSRLVVPFVFVGAVLTLSGCSLFKVDAEGEEASATPTTVTPTTLVVPELVDEPPTTFDIILGVEELYEFYGIVGSVTFEDGVWVFSGTAPDENALALFLGEARRLEGVNITRSQIEIAPPADIEAAGESDSATEEAAATETAATEGEATLPLTGMSVSVILSITAMLLIAAGAFAVATGKHLWLKAQLTNAFRPVPLNTTIFEVQRGRRRRKR